MRNQVQGRRSPAELEAALEAAEGGKDGIGVMEMRQIRQELLGGDARLRRRAARESIRRGLKTGDWGEVLAAREGLQNGVQEWTVGLAGTALAGSASRADVAFFFAAMPEDAVDSPLVLALANFAVGNFCPIIHSQWQPEDEIERLIFEHLRRQSYDRLAVQFNKCFRSAHRLKNAG